MKSLIVASLLFVVCAPALAADDMTFKGKRHTAGNTDNGSIHITPYGIEFENYRFGRNDHDSYPFEDMEGLDIDRTFFHTVITIEMDETGGIPIVLKGKRRYYESAYELLRDELRNR